MVSSFTQEALEKVVLDSFLTEVRALKPGNVSRFAEGHGMTLTDFRKSAELVTPLLCDPHLSLGERILASTRVTMQKVGCNTNLGMILLFAPLIKAAQVIKTPDINQLQREVTKQLELVEAADAQRVFKAILTANPGGLGNVAEYDVHSMPQCTLWQAMEAASNRDSIANQYVNGFADVIDAASFTIKKYYERWKSVEWAAVACYLNLLSRIADSHIIRKSGRKTAEQIKEKATTVFEQFDNYDNPAEATDLLLVFDRELKDTNINPGTTADLTAASLLVFGLQNL